MKHLTMLLLVGLFSIGSFAGDKTADCKLQSQAGLFSITAATDAVVKDMSSDGR